MPRVLKHSSTVYAKVLVQNVSLWSQVSQSIMVASARGICGLIVDWRSQANRHFFLCKKYELLLRWPRSKYIHITACGLTTDAIPQIVACGSCCTVSSDPPDVPFHVPLPHLQGREFLVGWQLWSPSRQLIYFSWRILCQFLRKFGISKLLFSAHCSFLDKQRWHRMRSLHPSWGLRQKISLGASV